jgi:hypothetical protein
MVGAIQSNSVRDYVDLRSKSVLVIDIGSSTTDFAYINKGKEADLVYSVLPSTATNKKVKFESSDSSVVSVTADGHIVTHLGGQAVITVTTEDKGFTAKNNSEYRLVISKGVVDNDGNELADEQTITFKTYNQKVNNMVNMVMMFVMFGGIMLLSVRQQNKKEEDEVPKDVPKEAAFNPYKEAKRTGKTVDEVKAEQAKKEEKEAKKKARKKKKSEEPQEKKIENCAQYLNNVYHVHAPAPVSKEDRSIEALTAMRKAEKAPKQTKSKSKGSKGNQRKK